MMAGQDRTIEDLLNLFSDDLSAADILISKLMAQVSSSITRERIKLNMNQTAFANHIGVKQSQVSRWEQGNYNFSIRKIAEIAEKLDLDVNISLTDRKVANSEILSRPYQHFTQNKQFFQKEEAPEDNS